MLFVLKLTNSFCKVSTITRIAITVAVFLEAFMQQNSYMFTIFCTVTCIYNSTWSLCISWTGTHLFFFFWNAGCKREKSVRCIYSHPHRITSYQSNSWSSVHCDMLLIYLTKDVLEENTRKPVMEKSLHAEIFSHFSYIPQNMKHYSF